jgi:predicted anti-sigma-YlaC factor YlaD
MLNCKQVAQLASDYLDRESGTKLTWQMHIHLMMCANCRRFVRHLRIAKTVASQLSTEPVDAEEVLAKIKAKQQAATDDIH